MTQEDWREWMRAINGYWRAMDYCHDPRLLVLPNGKRVPWR